ncbi:MAG: M1 family aminopeptidase [Bacteroidota bacterium]
MFLNILKFELWYRLRRVATYIYFLIMVGTGLLYGAIMGGALGPEPALMMTGGGQNMADSPFNLHQFIFSLGQFPGIFIIAAFMAVPVFRDFRHNAHSLFFTKPITKGEYLGARFLGSFLLTLVVMSGLVFGFIFARFLPGIDDLKLGPLNLAAYIRPFLMGVVPFTFFTGAIFFATVSLSRNQLFIYLNALVVLVLFSVASALASQLDNKLLASLIDPSGGVAFAKETEYWTTVEKNTQLIPMSMPIVLNLLIWQAVAWLIVLITYRSFSFSFAGPGKLRVFRSKVPTIKLIGDTVRILEVNLPKVKQEFSLGKNLSLTFTLWKRELLEVLKNPIFLVIGGIGLLMVLLVVLVTKGSFETPILPMTFHVVELASGTFFLFSQAIIIFYSGEMVWKERTLDLNQIYDALPMPRWISYLSKLLALIAVQFVLMFGVMIVGICLQVFQGFFEINLGLYISTLFGFRMINMVMFCIFAFFIQTIIGNKYVGFFLTALFLFGQPIILSSLGWEDNLIRMFSGTRLSWSDMNGYGHFVGPFLTMKAYWGFLMVALGILTAGLWVRGTESGLGLRFRKLKTTLGTSGVAAIGVSLLGFIGMGSYIYYNTHVLNEFSTSRDTQAEQANYEKTYGKYERIPQPKITEIKLEVDLVPEQRDFFAKGTYWLKNKTKIPLDSIHIQGYPETKITSLTFQRGFEEVLRDTNFSYFIYELKEPLQPGDSVQMKFALEFVTKGFPNSGSNTEVVENGTFLSHMYFPALGYESFYELQDLELRKKYDLPEQERFPPITDSVALQQPMISRDADWLNFEAIVSTLPDQIAVTPGYLQREWEENGRKYYHYKMDSKMLKFYSIVSGRYEVMSETWKAPDGREVPLEIYHHPTHTYNLDVMMKGMKESLTYYSENFSPYQHQQMRILEFPRYRTFAQSFANTVPFSEGIGFVLDRKAKEVDMTLYVTAHEVAHQWWAHQVIGGLVQGFQFLSETMAQYSSLMVMEKLQGPVEIRKYLRHELDNYLQRRGAERIKEQPALLSENQMYIHYNKGSLVMYALKDYLGEEELNAALRKYVDKVAFQEAPFTTTYEWYDTIQTIVPDSLRYLTTDLFEHITLYDNKVEKATFEEVDGRYKVKLNLKTRKVRDDGKGNETELPVQDYIDVGVFARVKEEGEWKDTTLYLKKHLLTQPEENIEVWVDMEPEKVGIDPLYKLIDKQPDNNTDKVTKAK